MAKLRQRRRDQPTLFETEDDFAPITVADRTSTFLDNLSLPVHRWFRYSAGFSAEWARQVIDSERLAGRTRVLDPFVGSGTVLVEAEAAGVEGIGVEAHPFVCRVARTKMLWRTDREAFVDHA
jgi:DNA modification methylase